MQRNVTLTLDEGLIHRARVAEDEAYETAKRAALERLAQGAHLGGGPFPTRDELHDRAGRGAQRLLIPRLTL